MRRVSGASSDHGTAVTHGAARSMARSTCRHLTTSRAGLAPGKERPEPVRP